MRVQVRDPNQGRSIGECAESYHTPTYPDSVYAIPLDVILWYLGCSRTEPLLLSPSELLAQPFSRGIMQAGTNPARLHYTAHRPASDKLDSCYGLRRYSFSLLFWLAGMGYAAKEKK